MVKAKATEAATTDARRVDALYRRTHDALAAAAIPEKAPAMQAYMKSAMPYLGVPSPVAKKIWKELFASYEVGTREAFFADVLGLFRAAKFREERYAAIALSGIRKARAHQTPEAMPAYEEMITTGAWWDIVDELASHRVGAILASHPAPMKKLLRAWSTSDDLWKRRTSILAQLRFKQKTDLDFLYACIEPSLASKEFFLRKAIGWSLRQYAWTDPDEIVRYVRSKARELSPLSKREALKNVLRAGAIDAIP